MTRFASVALAFLALTMPPALGCSCLDAPVETLYKGSGTVAIGRLLSVRVEAKRSWFGLGRPLQTIETARFKVEKAFKHAREGDIITTVTDVQCCMCGLSVDGGPPFGNAPPGDRWLLLVDRGRLSMCSGSGPLSDGRTAEKIGMVERLARARH